uniref:Portal protein n=1 Tax=viral metagenome TaxID=1070528 RepID=A0A6M3L5L3_9ZZZZ
MADETTQQSDKAVPKDYNELLPPEGHKDVGEKLYMILDTILKDKDQAGLPDRWSSNYEFGKNVHWKTQSKDIPLSSANLMFTHRQRTVNELTDNNPTFNVVQIGSMPDEELIEVYLHTARHWWEDQNQQAVFERSVMDGETFNCCIEKVVFNPELEGIGEVETQNISPLHFGFYPTKSKDIQKADAVLHFRPMMVREAKRRWPDFADEIQADSEYLEQIDEDKLREAQVGKPGKVGDWFASIGSVIKHMMGNTEGSIGTGEEDELLIVEGWVKDRTIETIEIEEDGVLVSYTQPKYPGEIRCLMACNGGKFVLEDKPNPSINPSLPRGEAAKTYLFDKYPFILTQSITDTVNPWGAGDFEQLKGLQIDFNKSLTQFNLFKKKAFGLKLLNPGDSGVPNEQLDNVPRTLNPSNALVAAGIRYVDPPRVPAELPMSIDMIKMLFFLVSGEFELENAQTPGREVVSYKAIATLLERATTMKRGKVRNYSRMITIRGRMYFSHVQNWYDQSRFITYEKDGETKTKEINAEILRIPAKLTVVPGSTMPISQVQKREEAIGLAEKGQIDLEELLKRLDWPDWKTVVRRMKEGPFSAFLQMLGAMGAPEQLLGLFKQLMDTDPKDFKTAQAQGKVPDFNRIIKQLASGGQEEDPERETALATQQVEMTLKQAQTDKVIAEGELVEEKIITERLMQQVKAMGVTFDQEKLKIERARVATEIKAERAKAINDSKKIDMTSSAKGRVQGPYREKGLKSNNK